MTTKVNIKQIINDFIHIDDQLKELFKEKKEY